ncbi:TDP-4-oxo-6-deoxy-D-glucose aminotransferase, partial [Sesbania bispinosa]
KFTFFVSLECCPDFHLFSMLLPLCLTPFYLSSLTATGMLLMLQHFVRLHSRSASRSSSS